MSCFWHSWNSNAKLLGTVVTLNHLVDLVYDRLDLGTALELGGFHLRNQCPFSTRACRGRSTFFMMLPGPKPPLATDLEVSSAGAWCKSGTRIKQDRPSNQTFDKTQAKL